MSIMANLAKARAQYLQEREDALRREYNGLRRNVEAARLANDPEKAAVLNHRANQVAFQMAFLNG